jgi:hypothetical protein
MPLPLASLPLLILKITYYIFRKNLVFLNNWYLLIVVIYCFFHIYICGYEPSRNGSNQTKEQTAFTVGSRGVKYRTRPPCYCIIQ